MIRATEVDQDEIVAALLPKAEFAMFPLNNLIHHGMGRHHPFAVTMWLTRGAGGITDVLTLSTGGMVMPFLPSGDFFAAARALGGAEISGIVGPREWSRGVEAALALAGPRSLDHDEPHFLLDRADLTVPEGPGHIVPLAQAPEAVIKGWMRDYEVNTLNTPADQAAHRVEESYANHTTLRSHVVLTDGDTPLAMTGFNAQVPDIVQVGGVYTPPDLRGRGHARRAVALHLAAAGARRAVLFSASVAAARAYRAIGFRQIGEWTLLLLADRERVT